MLLLVQLESCVKIKNLTNTIFANNKQLDAKQWYVSKGVSKGSLFAITNLKTALAALEEISYEGEGGVACSPVISTNIESKTADDNLMSKSHYAKFQEMAFERELTALARPPPLWAAVACMDQNSANCGCVLPNGTVTYSSSMNCLVFCFTGKSLAVDQQLEVWPIKSFDISSSRHSILKETKECSNHFDQTYTALLHCLGKFIVAFEFNSFSRKHCHQHKHIVSVYNLFFTILSFFTSRYQSQTNFHRTCIFRKYYC